MFPAAEPGKPKPESVTAKGAQGIHEEIIHVTAPKIQQLTTFNGERAEKPGDCRPPQAMIALGKKGQKKAEGKKEENIQEIRPHSLGLKRNQTHVVPMKNPVVMADVPYRPDTGNTEETKQIEQKYRDEDIVGAVGKMPGFSHHQQINPTGYHHHQQSVKIHISGKKQCFLPPFCRNKCTMFPKEKDEKNIKKVVTFYKNNKKCRETKQIF